MTDATDQKLDLERLIPTSRRMLELREAVFKEWEKRVRDSFEEAAILRHPLLVNTLPAFYDNIAEAVTPSYPRDNATEGNSLAAEHGGERARITAYDHQALIGEYQIFRWAVFDVLHENGVQMTHREILTINVSIDEAVKQAVNAFTLVHSGLRERFVAALAHDLRGPLSAASLATEMILLSTDLAKIKMFAAKALYNMNRMNGMTKELLDSMAFEAGQRLALELSEFDVLEIAKEVQAQAPAAEGARMQIIGGSVVGWWSRDAMKRALENIVTNALKYGSPKTPISIKIDNVHERLLLSVHNEGPPIPAEEQEHIFQLFRRAESAKTGGTKGWGVGLPYVRGVAESHGGSVGIDSTAERGTTFVIDIPIDARSLAGAPSLAAAFLKGNPPLG